MKMKWVTLPASRLGMVLWLFTSFIVFTRIMPPTSALAAPFDNMPKILLHSSVAISKNVCAGGVIDCANAVTAGSLADGVNGPFYDVYLLTARGNLSSSAGFACGLFYAGNNPEGDSDGQGIEIFDFTGCTGLSLPSNPVWPKPTSYVLWYWDSEYNCRSDELFVAGYFYLGAYSADTLGLGGLPLGAPAQVSGCPFGTQVSDLTPEDLGSVVFSPGGATPGCNPCVASCLVTATETSTWSRIKALVWDSRRSRE